MKKEAEDLLKIADILIRGFKHIIALLEEYKSKIKLRQL